MVHIVGGVWISGRSNFLALSNGETFDSWTCRWLYFCFIFWLVNLFDIQSRPVIPETSTPSQLLLGHSVISVQLIELEEGPEHDLVKCFGFYWSSQLFAWTVLYLPPSLPAQRQFGIHWPEMAVVS